jgi:hypothetical protein
MAHHGLHWLTMVGTVVFVFAACGVLTLTTATFAALWVGRGEPGPVRPPADPDSLR